MFKRLGRLFATATPPRALAEALLVQTLATLVALGLELGFSTFVVVRSGESLVLVIGPLCLLWGALRMRIPTGQRPGQLLALEAAVGIALSLLPALLLVTMLLDIANGNLGTPSRAATHFE